MRTKIHSFDELTASAGLLEKKTIVAANAVGTETVAAVIDAAKKLPAHFILTGKEKEIREKIKVLSGNPDQFDIRDAEDPTAAARIAVELVADHTAEILMKGSVDTSTLLKMVLSDQYGLKTGRILSDVSVIEITAGNRPKLFSITDGGVTLNPTLQEKIELIANAVEVAHALGNDLPKIGILSATEFINPKLHSTVDAALLTMMNRRGQIKGCVIDGPLALDNLLWSDAAAEKKIDSPVAGDTDIIIAPNIETANALIKSAVYFAGMKIAHVIIGATVPILIPSRADKSEIKFLSIALGMMTSK